MKKDYIKISYKLALFICSMLIPVGVVNCLYQRTNFYQSINETYMFKEYPEQIELMNLGNSHEMYGLKYSEYYAGIAHNFATSSQPFQYDYYILRKVENSLADGAVVIVPISYFDWYYDYREIFKSSSYNTRYYPVLPPWYIYNYNLDDDIKYHWLSVLTAKENLKYIFNDTTLPELENSSEYCVKPEDIDNLANGKADSWQNHVMAPEERRKEALHYNRYYFEKIITYLNERGFQTVVMITPVTEQLTNTLGNAVVDEFDRITSEIIQRHPEVVFLDYSRESRFATNLDYFQDSDHLNSMGADCFTKCLLEALVKQGVIKQEKLIEDQL